MEALSIDKIKDEQRASDKKKWQAVKELIEYLKDKYPNYLFWEDADIGEASAVIGVAVKPGSDDFAYSSFNSVGYLPYPKYAELEKLVKEYPSIKKAGIKVFCGIDSPRKGHFSFYY